MLDSAARRVAALPEGQLVLDVGGWAAPLARADWVIDLLPYETRGLYGAPVESGSERFTADTWVQRDICASQPWPFADDQFDFVVCSHTLEDVRDPIRVCEELVRVGKAGYVEVPAPVQELTFGIHGPWVGWSHHHWISELDPAPGPPALVFSMKPHLLPGPGRHLPQGSTTALAPEDLVLALWWDGRFEAREQILTGAGDLDAWLDGLLDAARARTGHPPTARRGLRRRR